MNEIVGNIHLNFNDTENITTLRTLIDTHSTKLWYLLPEIGKDKKEHYHFYIENCNITDRHLRRKIIEQIPDLKKPIEGCHFNKDGMRKGWERSLKVSLIKPKQPVLTYEEEADIIRCYTFKDYKKIQPYVCYSNLADDITLQASGFKNRYYELLQKKQDLHNEKNNKKAKEHREYLKILIEGYNKDRTFMNACGVEELRPHTLQNIIDYVIDDKVKSNKVMNVKQIENTAVTMMIHLDKQFTQLIKQRIKINIENNYLC